MYLKKYIYINLFQKTNSYWKTEFLGVPLAVGVWVHHLLPKSACDMWHMTHDTGHVTHTTWHMMFFFLLLEIFSVSRMHYLLFFNCFYISPYLPRSQKERNKLQQSWRKKLNWRSFLHEHLPFHMTFFFLPFTFYILTFTFYLLPFTFYCLPFTFYPLSFTFYLLPFYI